MKLPYIHIEPTCDGIENSIKKHSLDDSFFPIAIRLGCQPSLVEELIKLLSWRFGTNMFNINMAVEPIRQNLTALHWVVANNSDYKDALVELLIKHGADVNFQDKNGRTPLHAAKDVKSADFLIANGANINAQDRDGRTPLHLAVLDLDAEMVKCLIGHGADDCLEDKNGKVPIKLNQKVEPGVILTQILAISNLLTPGIEGCKVRRLFEAVQKCDIEKAALLIKDGVNVDTQEEKSGYKPLGIAVQQGYKEIAEWLIENGADVNIQGKEGYTPLHLAVKYEHPQLVETLLKHLPNVNVKDSYGCTPLHLAVKEGHIDISVMLFDHGADINTQDNNGYTPLHLVRNGWIIAYLINKGANINAQGKDGYTPLHLAVKNGHKKLAETLLKYGANANVQGWKDGHTPLHLAKSVEMVKSLIERGANINAQDKDGYTPVHLAVLRGEVEIVKLLVQHGANIDIKDNDGYTPLDLAREKKFEDIAELLELGVKTYNT